MFRWRRAAAAGETGEAVAAPVIRDDTRARKILFDTFWTSAGWRERRERTTPEADAGYAKAAGYMFEPRTASHDEWVALAIGARERLALDEVAEEFVSSLSTRRLSGRSALGSLAAIRHLAPHRFRRWAEIRCAECGLSGHDEDLNVLSFERHKWGGVRHGNVAYAWFDLDMFARTERHSETDEDVAMLNAILRAARDAPNDATPRDLERAIASVIPSSRAERDILLGILALTGVLATPDHPGLLTTWVPDTDREPPPRPWKNDWLYPMFWWRGSIGVNEPIARDVFGARIT